jgi:hypothetical protein
MRSIGTLATNARVARRRRAMAALICVFLGGASAGAAVGLTYTQGPRREYEKAFDSIGLSATQRRATDSIMTRYACTIDSMNFSIAPHVDSLRQAARQDVLEVLTEAQVVKLRQALNDSDNRRGLRRSEKRSFCNHAADSAAFLGRSHHMRL